MRYLYFGTAFGNQSPAKNVIRQTIFQTISSKSLNEVNIKVDHQKTQGRNPCLGDHQSLGKWREIRATYSKNHPVNQRRPTFPVAPQRLIRRKLKNGEKRRTESWQRATTKIRDDWPHILGHILTITIAIAINNNSTGHSALSSISNKTPPKPLPTSKTTSSQREPLSFKDEPQIPEPPDDPSTWKVVPPKGKQTRPTGKKRSTEIKHSKKSPGTNKLDLPKKSSPSRARDFFKPVQQPSRTPSKGSKPAVPSRNQMGRGRGRGRGRSGPFGSNSPSTRRPQNKATTLMGSGSPKNRSPPPTTSVESIMRGGYLRKNLNSPKQTGMATDEVERNRKRSKDVSSLAKNTQTQNVKVDELNTKSSPSSAPLKRTKENASTPPNITQQRDQPPKNTKPNLAKPIPDEEMENVRGPPHNIRRTPPNPDCTTWSPASADVEGKNGSDQLSNTSRLTDLDDDPPEDPTFDKSKGDFKEAVQIHLVALEKGDEDLPTDQELRELLCERENVNVKQTLDDNIRWRINSSEESSTASREENQQLEQRHSTNNRNINRSRRQTQLTFPLSSEGSQIFKRRRLKCESLISFVA